MRWNWLVRKPVGRPVWVALYWLWDSDDTHVGGVFLSEEGARRCAAEVRKDRTACREAWVHEGWLEP